VRRIAWLALTVAVATAHAERWPVRAYTTADGLANDRVDHIARDDRGYLWFASLEGLSRFDGHDFVTFRTADGLPADTTNDVIAARDGTIWAATDGGLAWLDPRLPAIGPRFHALPAPDSVMSLAEDARGTVWAGTSAGLVRVARDHVEPVALPGIARTQVIAIAPDARDDSLWLGTSAGLVHREHGGAIERYTFGDYLLDDRVFGVLLDHTGRLWIGYVGNKVIAVATQPGRRLAPEGEVLWDAAARGGDWLRYEPAGWTRRGFCEDSSGTIWIGTTGDLVRYDGTFTELGRAQLGIEWGGLSACVEDAAGNLWFGSASSGVVRLAPHGLRAFDQADGFVTTPVQGFFEDGAQLYAYSYSDGVAPHRFDGKRFVPVTPYRPPSVFSGSWGWGQAALIDRDGSWWITAGPAVMRYPKVARFEDLALTTPRLYGKREGLPGLDVFRVYEDRRGDIWISVLSPIGLARWDRASDRIVALGDGWPRAAADWFTEDAAGDLWIGFNDGELVRVHDGVPHATRVTSGAIETVLVERSGTVWVASLSEGLLRVDAAGVHRVLGLASQQGLSLVDDLGGRIYLGTTHGIDRVDPKTGEVVHFARADGLPNENITAAFRSRDGSLWFATKGGAAHLLPAFEHPPPRAPTYITDLTTGGDRFVLPAGGTAEVPSLELGPDEDQLDIKFTAPSYAIGERVQFAYRLERDGAGEWSTPVAARELHFARLAAGSYRFFVRAVYPDGSSSPAAQVTFRVMPPLWRRWWFIALAGLVVAAAGYRLYRWRLAHVLALERVRTRIATDLHDELGANLSRISILSEVASRRAGADADVRTQVSEIGRSARELVDVASDIVWSTDPRRDDLQSIVVRLRAFAGDVLEARGMAWSLEAPHDPERIKLSPDQRRHLYLVLKEAIHNAARHSSAKRVEVAIARRGDILEASVRDDGCGMSDDAPRGNGLANMRTRAGEAKATIDIHSEPGQGTQIRLALPLRG
jgi:signal transduction histidine kinase/ligand-binding sensor domain-containing protein